LTSSNIASHLEECSSGAHLCSVYNTREEQFASFVPYIKIGLEREEKCLYILDENSRSDILMALSLSNVDVGSALESGALLFLTKPGTCLESKQFDSASMMQFLEDALTDSKLGGFSGLRIAVEMNWILGSDTSHKHLMNFASGVTDFVVHKEASLLCQCNMSLLPADMVKSLIYAHPLIIFADMLCENTFYSPAGHLPQGDSDGESLDDLLISVSVSEYLRRNSSN